MKTRLRPPVVLFFGLLLFLAVTESKKLDPYKVLGVDQKASQREIQKAFHKLSLQYHPDKNKNKGAQEKFAEINNAYDILSDEEKRKNYDLYGDERGNPGFDAGGPGDQGGYTHFTSGGPGQGGFTFRPGGWQNMGGQGGSKSFSFSFGGPGSQSSQGFGFDDIFSSFFGGNMGGASSFGSQSSHGFGGFGSSGRSDQRKQGSAKSLASINPHVYKKEILNKGMTWLLLSFTSNLNGIQYYESIVQEVASSLEGALKVGSINCETDTTFCKEIGVYPRRAPRVFVYSYISSESGSLVEYNDDLDVKTVKSFCRDHLPRFSKRVNLGRSDIVSENSGTLPKVLLLSTKKETPVIWRVLSGIYHNRIAFYDAQVHDVSNTAVKNLGIDSLPAIVGWLSNGEKHIIKSGISTKDLKSTVQELSGLLDNFERKNKKAASAKKEHSESGENKILLLTRSNFDDICGDRTPVCVIGAFRSSKAKDKLGTILKSVSQKSLSRPRSAGTSSKDAVSYALLDATKQQSFLNALDKSGFKSSDKLLVAYKPKRGTYATLEGEITLEEAETFISSVLNGDIQFTKTKQKPYVK